MKPKRTRTTSGKAGQQARKLNMKLKSGGGRGSICLWSNGAYELSFVPDNAYTEEGWQTIRDAAKPTFH